jgi:hypothetical protein
VLARTLTHVRDFAFDVVDEPDDREWALFTYVSSGVMLAVIVCACPC